MLAGQFIVGFSSANDIALWSVSDELTPTVLLCYLLRRGGEERDRQPDERWAIRLENQHNRYCFFSSLEEAEKKFEEWEKLLEKK